MRDREFRAWLTAQGQQSSSVATRVSDARRVETHHGDLDAAFESDGLESLLATFAYGAADKAADKPNPTALSINGDLYDSLASYRSALTAYRRFRAGERTSGSALDRAALERLRRLFLTRYPDFTSFTQTDGGYLLEERAYKDRLIALAATALAETPDETILGARLLDIVTGRGGAASNLLGWRANRRDGLIATVRERHPGVLERAAGRLARATDITTAIAGFVQETWPLLAEDQPSQPYADSRNLPTMIAALVDPARAFGINTEPVRMTGRALLDRTLFGWNPLTAEEYAETLAMAEAIRDRMDGWGWAPRDLWDVQGFIWAVNRSDQPAPSDAAAVAAAREPPVPTNLILYGPPGTGKTYATAEAAVRLCGEAVPADRTALMAAYTRLAEAGRIEFVTFHQSIAYEDFVEGLRPRPIEGGGSGFELKAEPGVFRRIARRAETSTGPGRKPFEIGDRQVFKMSIGEFNNPEDEVLFEEAIDDGCTLLGHGEVDWSDQRFAKRDAFIEAWRAEGGQDGEATAMSGRVQMPFMFRNSVNPGDIIVVSKGNGLFRAIGEVAGDYQYKPRVDGRYAHRRAVRWLWADRVGVPASEIYARNFSMKSIYLFSRAELNLPALERYIASQQDTGSGAPEAFVLIIDEINRANISKVFGELITLLEPDKRLGAPNALKVRLPYSGEVFGVPANLHIVGTMNTADRSIALLDTALRRRFEFRELMPDPSLLGEVAGVDLGALLATLNERIEHLFDREHQVGHAYFMGCRTRDDVDGVMRRRVIPLLAEYFFEDWSKVAAALGDADESEGDRQGGFLDRRRLKAPGGLGEDGDASPRYRWTVRSPAQGFHYDNLQ